MAGTPHASHDGIKLCAAMSTASEWAAALVTLMKIHTLR
jgi:hypothetical protein